MKGQPDIMIMNNHLDIADAVSNLRVQLIIIKLVTNTGRWKNDTKMKVLNFWFQMINTVLFII